MPTAAPLGTTVTRFEFDAASRHLERVYSPRLPNRTPSCERGPALPPRHDLMGPSAGSYKSQARAACVASHTPEAMSARLDARSYALASVPIVVNSPDALR